jgi:hypothetical protein
MTHSQVINAMNAIQNKQIARQLLTAEEAKMQAFHFQYGKVIGAKEYLKSLSK